MRNLLYLALALTLALAALRVLGIAGASSPPAPPATGPEEALSRAAAGLAELDLRPIWDELPPARQAQAEEVVELARQSARPEVWERGFRAMERGRDLLADKAELLLSSKRLADIAGGGPDLDPVVRRVAIEDVRARLEALLTTVLDSGLADPDNLRYLDLRELAGGFLPTVEDELRELDGHGDARLLPAAWQDELARLAARPLPARPGSAPLSVTLDLEGPGPLGLEPTVQVVPFEGRWLEARLAANLPVALDALRAEAELWITPTEGAGDPAMDMLDAVEAGLDGLEAAATPAELDAALDGLTGRVAGALLKRKLGRLFG